MTTPTVDNELHIASFVVQHRREAAAALAARVVECGDMELARSDGSRSIVLCECADPYLLLDRIEALRAVPGVLNVVLVYHHAEPCTALEASMPDPIANGAVP